MHVNHISNEVLTQRKFLRFFNFHLFISYLSYIVSTAFCVVCCSIKLCTTARP